MSKTTQYTYAGGDPTTDTNPAHWSNGVGGPADTWVISGIYAVVATSHSLVCNTLVLEGNCTFEVQGSIHANVNVSSGQLVMDGGSSIVAGSIVGGDAGGVIVVTSSTVTIAASSITTLSSDAFIQQNGNLIIIGNLDATNGQGIGTSSGTLTIVGNLVNDAGQGARNSAIITYAACYISVTGELSGDSSGLYGTPLIETDGVSSTFFHASGVVQNYIIDGDYFGTDAETFDGSQCWNGTRYVVPSPDNVLGSIADEQLARGQYWDGSLVAIAPAANEGQLGESFGTTGSSQQAYVLATPGGGQVVNP